MFLFFLRKLVASLLYPPMLSLLVALAGLLLILHGRFVKTGKSLIALGLIALLLLSIPALQEPVLRIFEPPPTKSFPADLDAIVVLGGGVNARGPETAGTHQLSATSLARAVEGIRLAHEFPETPLTFTGGTIADRPASSQAMAQLARELGIVPQRIVTFQTPTSTAEEARRTAEKWENGRIILVTSALHMQRATALFEREGLSVTPAPTDYQSDPGPTHPLDYLPNAGTWLNWQRLFHELYGQIWASLQSKE